MALVAKQTLRMGRQVIATAGTVVSPAMVEANNWQDLVYDDGITVSSGAEHLSPPAPKPARKNAPRKKK